MLLDRFFYPPPPELPPVVVAPLEDLLARLETVLDSRVRFVPASLQAGLSPERISTLEARLCFSLGNEVRALYRWRNGTSPEGGRDFIPGHRFLPLEESIEHLLEGDRQVRRATLLQRAAYRLTAGYRKSWLTLLDDGAGDGYFFDPKRQHTGGAIFYHFAEDGHYHFFPSLRNLVAGVIACFEEGIYFPTAEGGLGEDYARSAPLWERFGAANPRA